MKNRIVEWTYDYSFNGENYEMALNSFQKQLNELCDDMDCEPIGVSHKHDYERKLIEALIVVKDMDEY